jgi:glycosyltransferase involved in cell wall biosynthesis
MDEFFAGSRTTVGKIGPDRAFDAGAPLVSCIMATRNRPHFVRQALRCFLRQTYSPAELIVVDDGELPVEDLCAGLPNVRYTRLQGPVNLGAKLNLGIQSARGDIIQKLDDDDYYQSGFLELAAGSLDPTGPDRNLVAWDCFLVLLAGDRRLRHSGHGWTAGGTFCFHRDLWRRTPFRDLPRAVDAHFLRDAQPKVRRICAPELYVLVRHGHNTWTSYPGGASVDEYLRRLPPYHKRLEELIEPIDRPFYDSLTCGEEAPEEG